MQPTNSQAITTTTNNSAPVGIARINKSGKSMGTQFNLMENDGVSASAGDIRAALKKTGLKGKELTLAVNQALHAGSTLARARGAAFLSYCESNGFSYDHAVMNKAQDAITIKMLKPAGVAPVATVADAATIYAESLGMTVAQLDELVSSRK